MCTSARGPESPGLLRGEAPRKRGPGGSKDARETIGFSTRSRIARWNCAGLSNLTMIICKETDFDFLGITQTHGCQGDPTAMYSELPTAGDKYAGCCISLSSGTRAVVMHSGSLGRHCVRPHQRAASESARHMRIRTAQGTHRACTSVHLWTTGPTPQPCPQRGHRNSIR